MNAKPLGGYKHEESPAWVSRVELNPTLPKKVNHRSKGWSVLLEVTEQQRSSNHSKTIQKQAALLVVIWSTTGNISVQPALARDFRTPKREMKTCLQAQQVKPKTSVQTYAIRTKSLFKFSWKPHLQLYRKDSYISYFYVQFTNNVVFKVLGVGPLINKERPSNTSCATPNIPDNSQAAFTTRPHPPWVGQMTRYYKMSNMFQHFKNTVALN